MKLYGPERIIKNIIPDIRDNLEMKEEPPIVERTIESREKSEKVLERLFPEKDRERLLFLTEQFEDDSMYRARVLVGEKDAGTVHPHDFVVEKKEGALSIFFVDPEHIVGKGVYLRPKIGNLMSARISADSTVIPEVTIVRFKTDSIEDKGILKLKQQLDYAKRLVDDNGMPGFLRDNPHEIIFRAVIKEGTALAQSRYSNIKQLGAFLDGKDSSKAIEGKIDSQHAILKSFARLLKQGKFEKI